VLLPARRATLVEPVAALKEKQPQKAQKAQSIKKVFVPFVLFVARSRFKA